MSVEAVAADRIMWRARQKYRAQRFTDRRKEASRRACRGRVREG